MLAPSMFLVLNNDINDNTGAVSYMDMYAGDTKIRGKITNNVFISLTLKLSYKNIRMEAKVADEI